MSAPHNARDWRRLLRFFNADPVADFNDELRDHIDSAIAELMQSGMSEDHAREEALRRFGDIREIRNEVQRVDSRQMIRNHITEAVETFVQDATFATRVLRKSPAFTLVAIFSIALAVAANTTVFSVLNALLLRPIPGVSATRLARVYVNHHSPFNYHDLAWFRDRQHSFDGFVGERSTAMSFDVPNGTPERVLTSLVTRGFFTTLGVNMAIGRGFEGDERAATASVPVAVLTHRFWEDHFPNDSGIVGKTILLSGHQVTIVGVTSSEFRSSVIGWAPDIIVPLAALPTLSEKKFNEFEGSFYVTARLKSDANQAGGGAELTVLMSQLARTDSAAYNGMTVRLDHVRGVNAELRPAVLAASSFLMAMVLLVLLIACANVANLLLGRATARQGEIGLRLALGAGRQRIIRQLLTESLLLAAAGSAIGLASTFYLTKIVASVVPAEAGMSSTFFQPDGRVLVFTVVVCVFTAVLFGLLPASRAASPSIVPMFKGSQQHAKGGRGRLIAVQAALCVLLLAIASLFGKSFGRILRLDPGFRSDNVIDLAVDGGLVVKDETLRNAMFARLQARVSELPGVQSATMASLVPLSGSNMESPVLPEGMKIAGSRKSLSSYLNIISSDYFTTLVIPIRAGRPLLDTDAANAPLVAVINETAARRWWPKESAIGKRFFWGGSETELVEVVGIAQDANYNMPGESRMPFVYLPLAQHPQREMILQVKTNTSASSMRKAIWDLLHSEVPALPPPPITEMREDMAITLLPVKAGGVLLGILGGVALLLATAGIYAVTTYAVARRTREIGIRSALGANRAHLLQTITLETLRPVLNGVVAGVGFAIVASLGLSRVLYGVSPFDPPILIGVVVILGAFAAVASILPAWRAVNVDAVYAIRNEE